MIRSIPLVSFSIVLFGIVESVHCLAANQVTTAEENSSNREGAVQKICERTLALAPEVPSGDEGFIKLFSLVTEVATKESPKRTVRENNEAAFLSLAILIGEDHRSVKSCCAPLAETRRTLNATSLAGA